MLELDGLVGPDQGNIKNSFIFPCPDARDYVMDSRADDCKSRTKMAREAAHPKKMPKTTRGEGGAQASNVDPRACSVARQPPHASSMMTGGVRWY